jgi:hypothetical protein
MLLREFRQSGSEVLRRFVLDCNEFDSRHPRGGAFGGEPDPAFGAGAIPATFAATPFSRNMVRDGP